MSGIRAILNTCSDTVPMDESKSIARTGFGVCIIALFYLLHDISSCIEPFISWEDGSVFLTDGVCRPYFSTLLLPYEGYFHLCPRAIAGCLPRSQSSMLRSSFSCRLL